MDNFLKTHRLVKLTQEILENLSMPIASEEIGFIINNLSREKPRSTGFTGDFIKYLKKNEHQSFINSSRKQRRREHF